MCTLAKAAGKVIALMDLGPGLPRRELRCEARHESDLGIARDNIYALLEASALDGPDLSQLDSQDRSTPVAAVTSSKFIWFGITVALSWGRWPCSPHCRAGPAFSSRRLPPLR